MSPCDCRAGPESADEGADLSRRDLLKDGLRAAAALGLLGGSALLGLRGKTAAAREVWQIDPAKCVQCGQCATACVLGPSAVKCVHAHDVCGYCDLCFAYFRPETMEFDTGAEKQLCPTFAIRRRFIEEPYYEYAVDEERCVGCARCVRGCQTYGNGSLYLQIRHDLCVGCNECAIAKVCPAGAVVRVDGGEPYILKGADGNRKTVARLDGRPAGLPNGRRCNCTPSDAWRASGDGHA